MFRKMLVMKMLHIPRSLLFAAFLVLTLFMSLIFLFNSQAVERRSHVRLSTNEAKYFDQNDQSTRNLTTEAANIQHRRRTRMHRVCKNIMGLEPIDLLKDNLRFHDGVYEKVWLRLTYFVDDQKLAFFLVLKAGYSHWLRFISNILTEGTAIHRPGNGVPFTLDEIRPKLGSYKKIIFVRNPISRLVSGYVDKHVDLPTEYYTNVSRNIIAEVRGKPIPGDQRPDLTFPEFLHFILTTKNHLDAHWKPISEQYVPCDIDYDFIGKLETVNRDIDYLKSLANIPKTVVYPEAYISKERRIALMLKYYRPLPTETIEQIIHKYQYDFLIFGYPLPKNASDIVGYITNDMKPDDFYHL